MRQRTKERLLAGAFTLAGLLLVLSGVPLDNYAEAVVLELGAALMLFGPLYYGERVLTSRVDEVEDAVTPAEIIDNDDPRAGADRRAARLAWEAIAAPALEAVAHRVFPSAVVAPAVQAGGLVVDMLILKASGEALAVELKSRGGTPVPREAVMSEVGRASITGYPTILVTDSGFTRAALHALDRLHGSPPPLQGVVWRDAKDNSSFERALRRTMG